MQIFGGEDVSQPNISDITPTLSLSITQSVPLLLDAIALEEVALAHLINSEAEKSQILLGTTVGAISVSPSVVSVTDLLEVDKSVRTTLQGAIKKEILLEFDFENVMNLLQTVTPGPCPLTHGKTIGFWGNNNGNAILDPDGDGDIDPAPVTIGEIGQNLRGVIVATITVSNTILPSGPPPGHGPDYCSLEPGGTCQTSDSLNQGTLEILMAQTLALSYNIRYITCYTGQTVSALGCASLLNPILGLPPSATVNDVLAVANFLIGHSLPTSPAPQTTQAEAGAMNALLGCLNEES